MFCLKLFLNFTFRDTSNDNIVVVVDDDDDDDDDGDYNN